jgi:hypothetical protein
LRAKIGTPVEELCAGLPVEFAWFLSSVRGLDFEAEPDYAGYRRMFRELFMREGFVYEGVLDLPIQMPARHEIMNGQVRFAGAKGVGLPPTSRRCETVVTKRSQSTTKLTLPVFQRVTTVVVEFTRSAPARSILRPVSRVHGRDNPKNRPPVFRHN